MNTTEKINKFISDETDPELSINVRTRDALNIALSRLEAAEARADDQQQRADSLEIECAAVLKERDDARRQLAEAQARITQLEAERVQMIVNSIRGEK